MVAGAAGDTATAALLLVCTAKDAYTQLAGAYYRRSGDGSTDRASPRLPLPAAASAR